MDNITTSYSHRYVTYINYYATAFTRCVIYSFWAQDCPNYKALHMSRSVLDTAQKQTVVLKDRDAVLSRAGFLVLGENREEYTERKEWPPVFKK